MAKKIVICCDGTGNEVEADETNVLRLARMLEQTPQQITYYDPGVGTQGAPTLDFISRQEILKILGMAMGMGVYDRVGSAYRYIMNCYQTGDEIFIFGFSRGAYAARVLAGVIAKIGILERSRENLVSYAIKLHSSAGNSKIIKPFREAFVAHRPNIRFLGLWDTVKSVYQFDPWSIEFSDVSLPYTYDNGRVQTVRHAIAIDERRRFYRTNLWTDRSAYNPRQDVQQVWFAGVHSDVGGSYPELDSGLSKISLKWMVREAKAAGLDIDPATEVDILPDVSTATSAAADPLAPMHQSLKKLWWIPEWWMPFPRGARRFIPPASLIHESVRTRMLQKPDYRPKLPEDAVYVS